MESIFCTSLEQWLKVKVKKVWERIPKFSKVTGKANNANNGRKPPSCPFPDKAIINKEAAGCINIETIGAINEANICVIIGPRNPPSCFLFHVFMFQ